MIAKYNSIAWILVGILARKICLKAKEGCQTENLKITGIAYVEIERKKRNGTYYKLKKTCKTIEELRMHLFHHKVVTTYFDTDGPAGTMYSVNTCLCFSEFLGE